MTTMEPRIEAAGTFEMLWDCGFCGTKGLLGVSHRRCPACGAPQDASKRYFPPEGQETALANHTFDGADWLCGGCQTPNGAKAAFCRSCGAPKEGNAAVARRPDEVAGRSTAGALASTAPKARMPRAAKIALGVAALVVVAIAVGALWKKEVSVRVDAHAWSREIDIERLDARREDAWCDAMPMDAYGVTRTQEARTTRQVPDGETCETRNVDNGDGSFRKQRECKPKYRSEPVYDAKCHFTVNRWGKARSVTSAGRGTSPAPSWPALPPLRGGACLGCEREGPRHERYTLELVGSDAQRYPCDVDAAKWSALADGTVRKLKVRVVTGGPVCDSL